MREGKIKKGRWRKNEIEKVEVKMKRKKCDGGSDMESKRNDIKRLRKKGSREWDGQTNSFFFLF